jgi:ribosomal protein S18 acetylase RimI-like enzyme
VTDIEKVNNSIETEIKNDATEEWLAVQGDQGIAQIMASYPAFYSGVRIDGKLVAVGRAAINQSWCVISRIFTDPDYRGKGYARAVINSLMNSAYAEGARKAVLQVDSKNEGAINLYQSLGFEFHHEYVYRGFEPEVENLLADRNCQC